MARRRLTPDEVVTAARLAGVIPELALAIYKQESSSGANVKTSPKGAVGGFQLMPGTFKDYGPRGGDIHDPVDNMQAGLAYLAHCLRRSGGDPEGAAQCYYHGSPLRRSEEGPTSGLGTPTTRQYGKQIVAKMRELGWQPEYNDEPRIEENPLSNYRRELTWPRYDRLAPLMPKLYGDTGDFERPEPFRAAPIEMPRFLQDYDAIIEDAEPIEEDENSGLPDMQMAGLIQPLGMSMTAQGIGGIGDAEMSRVGRENYDLDRYVRRIVDEEFKRA